MSNEDTFKQELRGHLQEARDVLVWKLDGLTEAEIRRPLTPTGTNLLGLVKHLAGVELLYLGFVFGRHYQEPVPWFRPDLGPDAFAPDTDKWATAEESREFVTGVYRDAWRHADATLAALPLDTVGFVPWWPREYGPATLHRVAVHLIAETSRHAGHADIVRELIDGSAGYQQDRRQLPSEEPGWWQAHRAKLAAEAAAAAGG
ncbi:DinB family protein [Kitasatospora sp. NPDC006697]|uniref:DinB family protein n=1 Tax=Kitasatospora sp. NPDC006697 TaxID=3364020 RepID=UPI0036A2E7CE